MFSSRILVIVVATASATANAQSIPQIVSQLQADVQALKTKAFNGGSSPAPAVFDKIDFFKGYATFKNSANKVVLNLGVGTDNSNPGIWLDGNSGASGSIGVWGNTGELNLRNNDGKTIFFGGEQAHTRSGVLRVSNASGQPVLVAGAALEDGGGTWIYNKLGKQIIFIGTTTNDSGQLFVSDSSGQGAARLGDGILRQFNHSGKEVATIGLASNQTGGIWLQNDKGEETIRIGTSDDKGFVNIKGRGNLDLAEVFSSSDETSMSPGSVVSMAEEGTGIELSRTAYDVRVVGVIAGAGGLGPAVRIGSPEDNGRSEPVAMAGQVFVRVCTEGGPIAIGDLLVASSRPGVAMRAADRARTLGAVVGKALQPYLGSVEGLVRMLVMTH